MPICKKCELLIIWTRKDGKFMPTNPDGSPHFQTCETEINRLYLTYGMKEVRSRVVQTESGPQTIHTEAYRYKGKLRDFHEWGYETIGKDYHPSSGDPF